jgi:hypothetical protein
VARAAEKVRDSTAAQIEVDGVQSSPLSKTEAEQLGAGTQQGKDMHERMQHGYLNKPRSSRVCARPARQQSSRR